MKLSWLSSRGRWGAASAAILAALFLGLSGTAQAGINDTKHNLGSGTGPAGRNQAGDTAEICVFCHTPHGANQTIAAPLWNRTTKVTTYQTYDLLATASMTQPVTQPGAFDRATLGLYEMGSVFKIFNTAIGLDSGSVTLASCSRWFAFSS